MWPLSTNVSLLSDLAIIMSTCKFSPLDYTPANDSVVDNIRIKATPPSAGVWGQNAAIKSSAIAVGKDRTDSVAYLAAATIAYVCLELL